MNYHDRLTDRERIRIHTKTKHEQLKAEAIDILIDAVHRQKCGGATVSFDHNLASKTLSENIMRDCIVFAT